MRIIRYNAVTVRDRDLINFLVSGVHTLEQAEARAARCPDSSEPPMDARHFEARMIRENREANIACMAAEPAGDDMIGW